MRRVLAFLAVVCVAGCGKSSIVRRIPWRYDVDTALAEAAVRKKPVAVFVGASWDASWAAMERVTLVDEDVRASLAYDFVPIYLDGTMGEDRDRDRALARFEIIGEPSIVLLDSNGQRELVRFTEFVPPPRLLGALRAVTAANRTHVGDGA